MGKCMRVILSEGHDGSGPLQALCAPPNRCGSPAPSYSPAAHSKTPMKDTHVEAILRDPSVRSAIPGLSLAVLRDGEITFVDAFGHRGAHHARPVDTDTVFEAASLTKPLVSFIAMQLAEEGQLDLAATLQSICGSRIPDDPRAGQITATHVLTHTSGLPNIVTAQAPLRTHFAPGARFSYGSSAFSWLQRAMETVSGQSLDVLARERVFDRFAMHSSSLQWEERFEANHAQGHEMDGSPVPKRRPAVPAASWSLTTTARDYAHFVRAVLRGEGLSAPMHARWLTPAVWATRGIDDVQADSPETQDDVAWGLGWGLEPSQGCFFHWGHMPGFRAFVMGHPATKDAVVWFANSARGLRLGRSILPAVIPGRHEAMDWLQVARTLQEP
ncbi:MAG: class A beta-lactamase-related serine hydrolase [Comamonadaceae bacterium]|nr:MAG: class A beta-lactamase-related serine hydrolase [Comamonadaceae bacterium]